MHDLGVALNFRGELQLKGTNVLNPEWVTNGVYKILNYHQLFQAKGVLEREMLSEILQAPDYPEDKHLFIMDMMRKFELCFDFEGFPNKRFLIPDMLPKDETYTGEWNDEDCLCFLYQYKVLPGSIMSRFIVRSHKSIHKNTYWRSGVVLEKDGNKALVKADNEEKTICIHVSGPRQTRRELLAVIRGRLKEIHGTISKLESEEKVPLPGRPDIVADYQHLLNLERMGETTFVPEGYDRKVNVKDLLNGVEPEGKRIEWDGAFTITGNRNKIQIGDKIMNKNFDFKGAEFKGQTIIADEIRDNVFNLSINDEAKGKLDELLIEIEKLKAGVDEKSKDDVLDMGDDASIVVKALEKDEPEKAGRKLSRIAKTAESLGKIALPVVKLAKELVPLLMGS